MPRNISLLLGLLCLLISACGGSKLTDDTENKASPFETPRPWEPRIGDENLIRGEVFLDEAQIIFQEDDPQPPILRLTGALPTPCHQLRVIIPEPDNQDQIRIEVYSLTDPEEICIQVLETFEASIPFEGDLSAEYEVLVEGESIEFIE